MNRRDPNYLPKIHTRAFCMQTKLHGEFEVEVRGTVIYPEYLVKVEDEWIDANEVFSMEEWDEAVDRAAEPLDTCHHGN